MATGTLEVRGQVDIDQLWPQGESDADTLRVRVDVPGGGFFVRPPGERLERATHAFDAAIVVGRVKRPPVDPAGRVAVRLQGIDAPELHYRPAVPRPPGAHAEPQAQAIGRYRQPCAELASVELATRLRTQGGGPLPCRMVTAVDAPEEALDTYGRFVGDLYVRRGAEEVHVNHWLVRSGWAFPAFYVSMSPAEIAPLFEAAAGARREKRGVWAEAAAATLTMDWGSLYRPPPAGFDAKQDQGAALVPKLFRRICTWAVGRRAGTVDRSFGEYLDATHETGLELEGFLEHGTHATRVPLSRLLDRAGLLRLAEGKLVFEEATSRLVRGGTAVVGW